MSEGSVEKRENSQHSLTQLYFNSHNFRPFLIFFHFFLNFRGKKNTKTKLKISFELFSLKTSFVVFLVLIVKIFSCGSMWTRSILYSRKNYLPSKTQPELFEEKTLLKSFVLILTLALKINCNSRRVESRYFKDKRKDEETRFWVFKIFITADPLFKYKTHKTWQMKKIIVEWNLLWIILSIKVQLTCLLAFINITYHQTSFNSWSFNIKKNCQHGAKWFINFRFQ